MQVTIVSGAVDSGKTAWLADYAFNHSDVKGVLCRKVVNCDKFGGYDLEFLASDYTEVFIREKSEFMADSLYDSAQWFVFRRFMFNQKVFDRTYNYFKSLTYADSGIFILDEAGPMEMENRGFHDILVFLLQQPGRLYLSVRPSLTKELPEYFGFKLKDIINLK